MKEKRNDLEIQPNQMQILAGLIPQDGFIFVYNRYTKDGGFTVDNIRRVAEFFEIITCLVVARALQLDLVSVDEIIKLPYW